MCVIGLYHAEEMQCVRNCEGTKAEVGKRTVKPAESLERTSQVVECWGFRTVWVKYEP